YVSDGTLEKAVRNGYVLTLRRTFSGLRPGLVGLVDLEAYDFAPGNLKPIRASEKTIVERLPARMRIREGALVECPHVMLLADDAEGLLVERVWEKVKARQPLYDFELMMSGGHLTGWAVEDGALLKDIDRAMSALMERSDGFLFAVGDGNHSLASAKACWENVKKGLSAEDQARHPARFALAEVVNLHCPALLFKPIHRAVFGADVQDLEKDFALWLEGRRARLAQGGSICFTDGQREEAFRVESGETLIDAAWVQPWLDDYVLRHPGVRLDYVHGDGALREICLSQGAAGIGLGTIDKSALFPSIRSLGVLPRKAFSMGEADEKRFYLEARLLG
ncbi:MAG: DUF1015 family protein, partial [Clostridia bacterium]|nr:DUF1015 family protein [Clostridia bacterium]